MNRSDSPRHSIILADGYSYTEIFEAPELPDAPSGHRLIHVFHALFGEEHERTADTEPGAAPDLPDKLA